MRNKVGHTSSTAPFRDIGRCRLSSWDIFKLTPFMLKMVIWCRILLKLLDSILAVSCCLASNDKVHYLVTEVTHCGLL